MALVKVVRPRVSYADLCQQPEDGRRYEIYDGEVFVVPSPLPLHQIVAMNISEWLRTHPRTRDGFVAVAPLDIVLSDYNVVPPDILYFEADRLQNLVCTVSDPRAAGPGTGGVVTEHGADGSRQEDAAARTLRCA